MSEARAESAYRWMLWDQARTRASRRRIRTIARVANSREEPPRRTELLTAIMLIETTERPLQLRSAERIAQLLGRRSTTCGPLQMAGAPWRLERATARGFDILERIESRTGSVPTISAIARGWNGAASRQPGSCFGYETAIRISLDVVRKLHHLDDPTWSPGKRPLIVAAEPATDSATLGGSLQAPK